MATNHIASDTPLDKTREWLEFLFRGYSAIAVRKHGTVLPVAPLSTLSNEELERMVQLVRDLAHLPPA